jgi:hypothetical protein
MNFRSVLKKIADLLNCFCAHMFFKTVTKYEYILLQITRCRAQVLIGEYCILYRGLGFLADIIDHR